MKMPSNLKELKFLLFPLLMLPVAAIIAFNAPPPKPIAISTVAGSMAIEAIVASADIGELHVRLLDQRTLSCDNLMPVSRYHPEQSWKLATLAHEDGTRSSGCWRAYKDYELTWDGAHYAGPVVAMCPLLDGARHLEACFNIPRDRFDFK